MSATNNSTLLANSSIDLCDAADLEEDADRTTLVGAVTQLAEAVTELAEENQRLRQRVTELETDVEDVEDTTDDLEDRADDADEHREQMARDLADTRGRVTDLEDGISVEEPHPSDTETPAPDTTLTPIEQLSRAEDTAEVTDSPSVQRAVSLFTNLVEWGSRTPKGVVLKPADNPLSLLEADRDESLAWKQYYRAAETLESLSKGAVTFFDSDRHGKMLVLHEQSEVHDRIIDGSLSASSVGVEG